MANLSSCGGCYPSSKLILIPVWILCKIQYMIYDPSTDIDMIKILHFSVRDIVFKRKSHSIVTQTVFQNHLQEY